MRRFVFCSLLLLAHSVMAETAVPSTEQMIQQLKVTRTRSLRNLTVEAAPAADANAANSNGAGATGNTGADSASAANAQAVAPTAAASAEARPSLSLSIQFDFDSSRIRAESMEPLGNLAAALASPALVQSKFVIEGHTDAKGNPNYNRKLSDQRASAVKELLISKGIDAARLMSVGKGSSELANAASPMAAENRRVKIVNLD